MQTVKLGEDSNVDTERPYKLIDKEGKEHLFLSQSAMLDVDEIAHLFLNRVRREELRAGGFDIDEVWRAMLGTLNEQVKMMVPKLPEDEAPPAAA